MPHLDEEIRNMMFRSAESGVYCCTKCTYETPHQAVMKDHVEAKHTQGPGLVCRTCFRICPTRKALKMHLYRAKH